MMLGTDEFMSLLWLRFFFLAHFVKSCLLVCRSATLNRWSPNASGSSQYYCCSPASVSIIVDELKLGKMSISEMG